MQVHRGGHRCPGRPRTPTRRSDEDRFHEAFVILGGTLPPIDRLAADRSFCSGKHKKHGLNVQVITDPAGRLLRATPALAGAVHDIKAA
ncbi:hypothetical protein GCM10022295_92440 [Streptomyces osmaniensis]|uniref:Transposase n=1 Tax=Streptomyces osmaniensis TaxID=593134 RepID=A0ABP6Z6L1_9ACTN